MKIQFLGAIREVTGSKHLLETALGLKVLLDCGMYQGKGKETDEDNRNLGFDPTTIDYIILSHAHIDHSGLIPYAVKNGFQGSVICTHATRDLCAILLSDSGRIQEHDTHTHNKKLAGQGLPPVEPLYGIEDAEAALQQFISISYGRKFRLNEEMEVMFTDNGHILGSASVNVLIKEKDRIIRLCYTGDIGRQHNMILKPPQAFPQADIIITESTYGDRLHDHREQSEKKLQEIILQACCKKKGKLIIPAFSVGRTQELVYAIHLLMDKGWLPKIKVFVDSPLSVNATHVMRMHPEAFNQEMLDRMEQDPDPFGFNTLTYVRSEEESKKLNHITEPCIIISASGMMEAGRVKHHLANSISNPNNTILVVGYCSPRTLGARIRRKDPVVSIYGHEYELKANVEILESYSAHGDYAETILFLSCQNKKEVSRIFLVHGEFETQEFYKRQLESNRFHSIDIPEKGQVFEV